MLPFADPILEEPIFVILILTRVLLVKGPLTQYFLVKITRILLLRIFRLPIIKLNLLILDKECVKLCVKASVHQRSKYFKGKLSN